MRKPVPQQRKGKAKKSLLGFQLAPAEKRNCANKLYELGDLSVYANSIGTRKFRSGAASALLATWFGFCCFGRYCVSLKRARTQPFTYLSVSQISSSLLFYLFIIFLCCCFFFCEFVVCASALFFVLLLLLLFLIPLYALACSSKCVNLVDALRRDRSTLDVCC